MAGAAARITNLGITTDVVNTADADAVTGALRAFQKHSGLDLG